MFLVTFYILHTHTWNFYENFLSLCLSSFSVCECLWIWCPCQMLIHRDLLPEAPGSCENGGWYNLLHSYRPVQQQIGCNRHMQQSSTQTPPLPTSTEPLLYSLTDWIEKSSILLSSPLIFIILPMMQLSRPSPLTCHHTFLCYYPLGLDK